MVHQKDLKGLAYIQKLLRLKGRPPSMEQIRLELGYASKRSALLLVHRLAQHGLIRYEGGKITLLGSPSASGENTIPVPLVGSVACGVPTLAEQDPEAEVRISTAIAKPGGKYFLLRAKGKSMDLAGINDGDLLLIRQEVTAQQGQIVVALIDDEATVKYFFREREHVVLRPKSTDPRFKPIVVSADLRIQGVFVTSIPDVLS